jgi:opacity protein-like surface antigen
MTALCQPARLRSREVQDRMKKIVIVLFLLAVCVATGRSQESRQDVSLSGLALIPPFVASSTNVQVHSNAAYGALVSYRFMLTPNSAIEANYGITYENTFHFVVGNTNNVNILTRTQELSGAYVRSFTFRKFNPFVEAGPAGLIFLPIRNSGTNTLEAKQQTNIAGMYGAGIAYEISPSFDIRAEYRGLVTKVPNFGLSGNSTQDVTTNKWFNIYEPVLGVAYHF